MYEIEITNRQKRLTLDRERIESIAARSLREEHVSAASISLVFVNDTEIHRINREYLSHDYPTDVISFLLEERREVSAVATAETGDLRGQGKYLEGEIFVSTDTACSSAELFGWSPESELVLYVVHGLLHLIGYDDLSADERQSMRRRERELLSIWGLTPPQETMSDDPEELHEKPPSPLPRKGDA